jgi:uncharacterized protein YaaQ
MTIKIDKETETETERSSDMMSRGTTTTTMMAEGESKFTDHLCTRIKQAGETETKTLSKRSAKLRQATSYIEDKCPPRAP